jgi:hypothetical protein
VKKAEGARISKGGISRQIFPPLRTRAPSALLVCLKTASENSLLRQRLLNKQKGDSNRIAFLL